MNEPTTTEKAITILRATRDGDDLSPAHLYLVQEAINHGFARLSPAGIAALTRSFSCASAAFDELHAQCTSATGYTRPWHFGVEHVTKDADCYVYWKGRRVEHFTFLGDHEAERLATIELAARCAAEEGEP